MPDFALARIDPVPDRPRKRPWWQWVIGGVIVAVILSAIFGGSDDSKQATTTVTVTAPAPLPARAPTPVKPTETIADAQAAADDDDYDKAIVIATMLGSYAERTIRQRIANRLARRAREAVAAGNRGQARSLLASADRYPTTALTRQARSSYRVAQARAAQRASDERAPAEPAAQPQPDEQATEEPQPQADGSCDPNYSGCVPAYPPDVNCPAVGGPVQVTGSDPHGLDRDGDGVGCQ